LETVTQKSIKFGAMLGVGMGTMFFAINASYSLGFWYGSHCVEGSGLCPPRLNGGSPYQAGDTLIIFFCTLMSGFYLSQLSPSMKKIAEGRVAAFRIFAIIDREPLIRSKEGCIVP
jgi:ATP-binding cassette subfamily B (MDR/TAP) protein 1